MSEHIHDMVGLVTFIGEREDCPYAPCGKPKPFSVRIPAAIAKAKEHRCDDWPCTHLTREEVDLAAEFYKFSTATQILVNAVEDEPPDVIWAPALIAFCEKIESLP